MGDLSVPSQGCCLEERDIREAITYHLSLTVPWGQQC